MKKVKKFFKVTLIIFSILISSLLVSGVSYYYVVTNSVSLDEEKLLGETSEFEIFDRNKEKICPTSENFIKITKLKKYTKDAFISAEDKRFYSHHGIDYIRLGGAMLSNIKSRSFSQGASTISQQLIKNTQLSSEKTINRKLKEMKMTRELESKYSKDEILEFYLNNIYFGNGCYGIENASKHYFNKTSNNLSIAESALLAGTINAPSIYDIESNFEKANERKDLILKLMYDYKKIAKTDYEDAKNEKITLNIQKLSNNNLLYNEIIEETCNILKISENELKNSKLKVYTYLDLSLQNDILSTIKNNYSNLKIAPNIASIVVENETNGIVAFVGDKTSFKSKRQPGSTIKPILVYAPAFENNIVSPATKINDEKININGYSPENADKKYHGFVSVRTALANSYNIPAVKLLNEIGVQNAQNFAKNLGIEFEENDNNLAIALGGFTNGTTLKSLTDAYTAFANSGNFKSSTFISKIVNNKKTIYSNIEKQKKVMKDSTAYLITDILKDTSKTGTAKRLKNLNYEIASKTGTVGTENSKLNTDAYNISYTSAHTILSYFGGGKMSETVNGATYPTMLTKDILTKLYKNETPKKFTKPTSVVQKNITKDDYEDNVLYITTKRENSINEIFSIDNLPPEKSELNFQIEVFNFNSKKPIISFETSKDYSYKIIRANEKAEEVISSASLDFKNFESNHINFEDKTAKTDEIYEYYVIFCENSSKTEYSSNKVKLKAF